MNTTRFVIAVLAAALVARSPAVALPQTPAPAGVDVLVVGGTPAGVAAAVTAARAGERVELVSALGDLGGTLTDAMMDQWDLNLAPNGASLDTGLFGQIYGRLGDVFTPAAAEMTFASMVAAEPNLTVRYGDAPVAASTTAAGDDRRIDAVTFRSARTSALETVRARYVIDATDDGDVAVLAGARYDIGRQDTGIDDREQAVTEMYTLNGVAWPLLAASYDAARDGAGGVVGRRAWGYADVLREYRPRLANVVVRDLNLGLLPSGAVTVNAIDVCGIEGLDPRQLALARRETEIEAPRLLAYLRPRLPGFATARIGTFASTVYVRETRHIAGIERLTSRDIWDGRIPADSIGLASYPIDLHPVDPRDEPAFAPERHVYGIPFGTLVPAGLSNVLLAGPAISASHEASGSARVIPTTIEEGEADGVAVAAAARRGWSFDTVLCAPSLVAAIRREMGTTTARTARRSERQT